MYISERIEKYIARREGMVFYCLLTNIFPITFKCIQNMVTLYFQFVKFLFEKYNMLGVDEDGRMLILHNKLLLYILECKWNKEAGHLVTKIFSFVALITRSVAGFRQFEKVNKEAIS